MHFRHAAVFAKTPLTDQGNHFQAEFAMREREATLLLLVDTADESADRPARYIDERPESTSTGQTAW